MIGMNWVDNRALAVLARGDVDGANGTGKAGRTLAGVALLGGVRHAHPVGRAGLSMTLVGNRLAMLAGKADTAFADGSPMKARKYK